ncbi:MAG: hypothetical protein Q4Q17_05250 [Tissierellia bacterium]|nr:hypothetical protein [Tissierellia bacterium]
MLNDKIDLFYWPTIFLIILVFLWAVYRVLRAIKEDKREEIRSVLIWAGASIVLLLLLTYGMKVLFFGIG